MNDEKVKITYPKFKIDDIVMIDPHLLEDNPGSSFIQISYIIENELGLAKRENDMMKQSTLDHWVPKTDRKYQVLDIFANHVGVTENEQFGGKEGYLLYVKSCSFGVPNRKYLIPDWMCVKADN